MHFMHFIRLQTHFSFSREAFHALHGGALRFASCNNFGRSPRRCHTKAHCERSFRGCCAVAMVVRAEPPRTWRPCSRANNPDVSP